MTAITNFTRKKRKQFLAHLRKTGNVSISAQVACVSRVWVYKIREKDPQFAAEWDNAVKQATDLLLEEARRRAYEGWDEPVFYQGAVCGSVRKFSDTLLMFKIKGERPEYATERREVSGRDGGPVEVRNLSDGEIDSKLSQLLGKAGVDSAPGGTGEAEE